jgi:IclR family transcriptional regulator, KDG regulon repressor
MQTEKVLKILDSFLICRETVSLTKLANLSDLNISTVSRIAAVLVEQGYLMRVAENDLYGLGPKFLAFYPVASRMIDIGEIANPFLMELNKLTGETVHLATMDSKEYEVINTSAIMSHRSLSVNVNIDPGGSDTLHNTGVGKILLAYMSEENIDGYFREASIQRDTPNTITDIDELKKHLQIVRNEGLAIDNEERELGIKEIAVPVRGASGAVSASIGVIGPSVRMSDERMKEYTPLVQKIALDISHAIGFSEK